MGGSKPPRREEGTTKDTKDTNKNVHAVANTQFKPSQFLRVLRVLRGHSASNSVFSASSVVPLLGWRRPPRRSEGEDSGNLREQAV
jgi:hypothetical protein